MGSHKGHNNVYFPRVAGASSFTKNAPRRVCILKYIYR